METHGREVSRYDGGVPVPTVKQGDINHTASKAATSGQAQEMHKFASGAKSTVVKPRYDLIPLAALVLTAERFAYGADRHGARNYRRGATDEVFITDRINHLQEHLARFAETRSRADLAAILCNAAILADIGAFVGGEEFTKAALESIYLADQKAEVAARYRELEAEARANDQRIMGGCCQGTAERNKVRAPGDYEGNRL